MCNYLNVSRKYIGEVALLALLIGSLGCSKSVETPTPASEAALASKTADTYMQAMKLVDLPESKRTLASLEFDSNNEYPVFTEANTLFENMYPTDVPGIMTYRRLIDVKAVSKAGTPLIKRYILVGYKDHVTQGWKVYGFSTETDVDYGVDDARNSLNDTRFILAKYNYRRYGYWLLMAGHINQAKTVFHEAAKLNKGTQSAVSEQSPPSNKNRVSSGVGTYEQKIEDMSNPKKDTEKEVREFDNSINKDLEIIRRIGG